MSEPSSKLFRDDPAAYYTELGAELERERIIKLLMDYAPHLTTEGLMQQIKGEQ